MNVYYLLEAIPPATEALLEPNNPVGLIGPNPGDVCPGLVTPPAPETFIPPLPKPLRSRF